MILDFWSLSHLYVHLDYFVGKTFTEKREVIPGL